MFNGEETMKTYLRINFVIYNVMISTFIVAKKQRLFSNYKFANVFFFTTDDKRNMVQPKI